ncbi:MAG TPA: amidohydrolase family protein [bacterium]|nr:amidohydrolase family protein [bacterium]
MPPAASRIIDSHLHLVTASMFHRMQARPMAIRPQALAAFTGPGSRLAKRVEALERISLQDQVASWKAAFDRAGVGTGFFIAVGEGNEELAEFVRSAPERFQGWGSVVDPTAADAAATVRRFGAWGLRGLKLYPPTQRFSASDRAVYPVYEAAAELGLAVLFHFGITIAPIYDLLYANPLHLSAAARDFPEITFGIAHCGAGFLREALFLAYHTENIWVDTSGTNNWREFTPGAPSLDEVFRDLLRTYGPRRILFGTDSTMPAEYRTAILQDQQDTFGRLGLSDEDRALIFEENARRLFRLGGPA